MTSPNTPSPQKHLPDPIPPLVSINTLSAPLPAPSRAPSRNILINDTPRHRPKIYRNNQNKPMFNALTSPRYQQNKTPAKVTAHEYGHGHEDSFAESVYLDLEEYSSIHKVSMAPYMEDELEDEYGAYLGKQESILEAVGERAEGGWEGRRVRRVESREERVADDDGLQSQHNNHDNYSAEFYKQSEKVQSHSNKSKAQFQPFQLTKYIYNKIFSEPLNKIDAILHLPLDEEQDQLRLFTQDLRSSREFMAPEWIRNKSSENILRLILTKNIRLMQYLGYLSELKICIKSQKDKQELRYIQNRDDVRDNPNMYGTPEKKRLKQSQQKESKKLNILEDKQIDKNAKSSHKSSDDLFQKVLSSVEGSSGPKAFGTASQKLSPVLNSLQKNRNPMHGSSKQKSPHELFEIHSEHEKSQNQFLPQKIQQKYTCPQVYKKQRHIQALSYLQILLAKLSTKKCNIYMKDQLSQDKAMENTQNLSNFLNPPLSQISSSNLQHNGKITKIQFQQFHDEADLSKSQQKSGSFVSRLYTYSQKIRNLTQELENKDRFIYEIKSNYDYVINNYINSIANLSNKNQQLSQSQHRQYQSLLDYGKSSQDSKNTQNNNFGANSRQMIDHFFAINEHEDQHEQKSEENRQNYEKMPGMDQQLTRSKKYQSQQESNPNRWSQPMTFKKSIQGINDSRQQDQWMGSSQPLQNIDDDHTYRNSYPSKLQKQQPLQPQNN